MRACAAPRAGQYVGDSWINDQLVEAYTKLHDLGGAHSIEAWLDGRLVGGLYGVHIGGMFAGESMFVRPDLGGTDASKVCLVFLVTWMRSRGMTLLDTQQWSPHLARFGCREVDREAYLVLLDDALHRSIEWGCFDGAWIDERARALT